MPFAHLQISGLKRLYTTEGSGRLCFVPDFIRKVENAGVHKNPFCALFPRAAKQGLCIPSLN